MTLDVGGRESGRPMVLFFSFFFPVLKSGANRLLTGVSTLDFGVLGGFLPKMAEVLAVL